MGPSTAGMKGRGRLVQLCYGELLETLIRPDGHQVVSSA